MTAHETRSQGTLGRRGRNLVASLFDVDTDRLESLSWPLGNRVTVGSDAGRRFRYAHRRSTRTVTVFAVTDDVSVVRLRTPVGREKFYEIATVDIASRPVRDDWVRTN